MEYSGIEDDPTERSLSLQKIKFYKEVGEVRTTRLRVDLTPYTVKMVIGSNSGLGRQEKAKHCMRLVSDTIAAGMLAKEGGQLVKDAEIKGILHNTTCGKGGPKFKKDKRGYHLTVECSGEDGIINKNHVYVDPNLEEADEKTSIRKFTYTAYDAGSLLARAG
ncbi:hypothetical protein CVT26_009583 [Gymnopilus dilepis]|uniref:Uncharacterized protein n=1 Tax=Gymnopilus dilepis TaxID=231916 RepID=A0A409YIM9_9AGAR|nr:hypothetical protein CVT26_009583 [Gymnopilus dilepis]